SLHYHAEQEPNPDSRISLSNDRDSFGVPRLRIDFRVTDRDVRSVVNSHDVLDRALRECGKGRIEYRFPSDQLLNEVLRQSRTGGTHQIGTTRMGEDAATSVVDSNLKAHGLSNLYIAASSVLRTSSQANPTLITTALAVRLAHHLKSCG